MAGVAARTMPAARVDAVSETPRCLLIEVPKLTTYDILTSPPFLNLAKLHTAVCYYH